MIYVDGSEKSGSGTIVRYAIAISSLLSASLHLVNIRAKREKSGLRPQHLKAVEACAKMTDGTIEGLTVGSTEIRYFPKKKIKGGTYFFDIGTAGSATMVAQTLLPLACFAAQPSVITIKGGLFQDFAPSVHHLQHVIFPLLKRMGVDARMSLVRPGYVPQGEGIIELVVNPLQAPLARIDLEVQGNISSIKGIALSSHLAEREVSDRMARSCNKVLQESHLQAEISCLYDVTAEQAGASLCVYLMTDTGCILGADMAGKFGRSSEFIGKKVAEMLLQDLHLGATLDRHAADQLILYAGLAKGTSRYIAPTITEHIETNLWLIEKMLQTKTKTCKNQIVIEGIDFI